ncbi:MAG: amidohydrolase [Ketobacter sp.]|nr:amidohydrolase [Ketobacter sp.]
MNRRELFKTTLAVGTVATLDSSLSGCSGAGANKIDVHHHALPDFYLRELQRRGISNAGVAFPNWTPQKSLNVMDFNNITASVLSLSAPGTYFGDAAGALSLARQVNEYLAGLTVNNPARFGFYATLPMPLVDESVNEAVYALDVLQADGVCLLTNSDGVYLGDSTQDDILAVLNDRGATVFVHPNNHTTTDLLGLDVPVFAVEFVIDTTRAVSNMVWNGTFERFPNIKWILAHAGGTIPYVAWRLSLLDLKFPELRERSPQGSLSYLKKLYFDTALSPTENSLYPTINQFGVDNIVLGTDYPFAPAALVPVELAELNLSAAKLKALQGGGLAKIYENGYKLFPRLQKRHFG